MIENRDYKKQDLADLLYPDTENPKSRMKSLWREVTVCHELVQELEKLRLKPNRQSYTRQQIAKIKEFLCRD